MSYDSQEATSGRDSVDSCMNEGMLMLSTDSFPEELYGNALLHSADSSTSRCCEISAELMNSSIKNSNLWSTLNVLRYRLGDKSLNRDKGEQDGEVMENFLEMFEQAPLNFTQHLFTILEDTSEYSISGMERDPTCQPGGSVESDSTRYMNLKKHGQENMSGEDFRENNSPVREEPLMRISIATPDRNSPTSPKEERVRRLGDTPAIVFTPSTPEPSSHHDSLESLKICIEDEDYVTAESEVDEYFDNAATPDRDKSASETIDLSKINHHHAEWVEAYVRLEDYEPMEKPTADVDQVERIKRHSSKLKKRWLHELTKKREKCFDAIKNLIAKTSANRTESSPEKSAECRCHRCERRMDLYNTLVVCSDFYTHMCDKRNSRGVPRRTVAKKSRHSFSRSPAKTRIQNATNSRETSNKRGTRKSLNKTNKSPGARYKSPCSVVAKSVKKTMTKHRSRAADGVDGSSIKPVSQLRMIFSPNLQRAGPGESKMAASQRTAPRKNIAKNVRTAPSPTQTQRSQCPSNFISPAHKAKFSHVKSPIAEYIRGKPT